MSTEVIRDNNEQEARRFLLNPQNGTMEEYHIMLYMLCQAVKNLYLLDLSIHILVT